MDWNGVPPLSVLYKRYIGACAYHIRILGSPWFNGNLIKWQGVVNSYRSSAQVVFATTSQPTTSSWVSTAQLLLLPVAKGLSFLNMHPRASNG